MDARNPDSTSPRPVKTTTEARQGVTGHHVRTVLFVGTGAAIALFIVLWLFHFGR